MSAPEVPTTSGFVFLSYGHDEHSPLAIRIRDDLQEANYWVWFDERLRPGDEEERGGTLFRQHRTESRPEYHSVKRKLC